MINNILKLKIIFLSLFLCTTALGKGQGKDGGDYVICKDHTADSQMNQKYFYDYRLALQSFPDQNWVSDTEELIELLSSKNLLLSQSIKYIYLAKKDKENRFYRWTSSKPLPVSDEDSDVVLEDCRTDIYQLVVRRKMNLKSILKAHQQTFEETKGKSWIFAHEAMWNFYEYSSQIYEANAFIHNRQNYELSREDFNKKLNELVGKVSRDYVDLEGFYYYYMFSQFIVSDDIKWKKSQSFQSYIAHKRIVWSYFKYYFMNQTLPSKYFEMDFSLVSPFYKYRVTKALELACGNETDSINVSEPCFYSLNQYYDSMKAAKIEIKNILSNHFMDEIK